MLTMDETDPVVEFIEEDEPLIPGPPQGRPWNILVVDDEEGVHEITRITLKDFSFKGSPLKLLSAYNSDQVREIMARETDIALILLDVVMESDDSGLQLVEYIRDELNNRTVRIVLRTGQPGKAPEQDVITRYDINEYKVKTDLTAQKLFTSITACLRTYESLRDIERNQAGMARIIKASARVFQQQTFNDFGHCVLEELHGIMGIEDPESVDAGYFVGMPSDRPLLIAGTGRFLDQAGTPMDTCFPRDTAGIDFEQLERFGEFFSDRAYAGMFTSKEGVKSLLYLNAPHPFSEMDRNLLRIYAHNISVGFDNISLAREIINTQKEVILTLGEVVETRSQETAHHVSRVAEFCYLLARKYGLPDEEADLLRLASPMHDVGKIGVPEAILHKPGRLTPDEFEVMKQHSKIGYEILRKSNRSIMQAASIVALQHHEKWDGSGYPGGLAGENIHIFGRIGAVADVYDALSHKRCYKDAWSRREITDYFTESSGGHFDPRLVEIFLENIGEFEAINLRFPG